jgi:hypothetical protein
MGLEFMLRNPDRPSTPAPVGAGGDGAEVTHAATDTARPSLPASSEAGSPIDSRLPASPLIKRRLR